MTGPRTANLDSMHTSQPICDAEKNDGIDIALSSGTPIKAPSDGVVSALWNDKTYGCGLTLMIELADGSVTGLAWLSATQVKVGEKVQVGEIIALSGQTGNANQPSLHWTFFTKPEGKVDPRIKLRTKQTELKISLTDPAMLQKALDSNAASDNPDYLKENVKKELIQRFYSDRALAAAIYKDNLDQATNAWYANNKNWNKIPSPIWDKLSDAYKGSFKSGIDPEIVVGR